MIELTFKLTEQEGQIILNALRKEPYGVVVDAINNIQKQAQEQMNPITQKQTFGVNVLDSDKGV